MSGLHTVFDESFERCVPSHVVLGLHHLAASARRLAAAADAGGDDADLTARLDLVLLGLLSLDGRLEALIDGETVSVRTDVAPPSDWFWR